MKPTVNAEAGLAVSGAAAAESAPDGEGAEGLLQASADSARPPETKRRERREASSDVREIVMADSV